MSLCEPAAAPVTEILPEKPKRKPRVKKVVAIDGVEPASSAPDAAAPAPSVHGLAEPRTPPVVRAVNVPQRLAIGVAQVSQQVRYGRFATLAGLGSDAMLRLHLPDQPFDSSGAASTAAAVEAAPAAPDPYRALVLRGPCGAVELADGVRVLRALTGIDLGASAVDQPTTSWLHAAVLGRLHDTPFAQMTAITRGVLPLASAEGAAPIMLRMTLATAEHAFSLDVRACHDTWLHWLAQGGWQRQRLGIDSLMALPLAIGISIGTHTLSQGQMATLAVGDIVIPDVCRFDCAGNGTLQLGRWCLRLAYVAPASMNLISLESTMEQSDAVPRDDINAAQSEQMHFSAAGPQTSSEHGADHGAALQSGILDDLPIRLEFEIGRLHTTLGALRTISPGSVLPIDGGSPNAITMIANGRTLGRGELVDVDGQLAIRILQWGL